MGHPEETIEDLFARQDALWLHGGEADQPHAILTSGLHSSGFFNGTRIIEDPQLMSLHVIDNWAGEYPKDIDWVFGTAMGAITLASHLAHKIGCKFGFTEKVDGGIVLKRFDVKPGDRVLVVEDTITTGSSTRATIEILEACGATVHDTILCIADRSNGKGLEPRRIVPVISLNFQTWKSDECPLCRAGSKALPAKSNWDKLMGRA